VTGNPCGNGGSCIAGEGVKYSCKCRPGWGDSNCNTPDKPAQKGGFDTPQGNPCVTGNPCGNGGSCIAGEGMKYSCRCQPGWGDSHCNTPDKPAQKDVNECESNPCQNGGRCRDLDGSYTCNCLNGYTGDNCETDVNECDPNPCQNGAVCNDGVNSYTCSCAAGYEGVNCETDKYCYPPNSGFIDNGRHTCPYMMKHGAECSIICFEGFELKGSATISCNNGEHSPNTLPHCTAVPVDGGFSDFGPWEDCSVTCGTGTQSRSRTCDNPAPSEGGNDCVGDATQTQECFIYESCDTCDDNWQEGRRVDQVNNGNGLSTSFKSEVANKEACEDHCYELRKTDTRYNAMSYGVEGFAVRDCDCIMAATGVSGSWLSAPLSRFQSNNIHCIFPEYNDCHENGGNGACVNGASCVDKTGGYECSCVGGWHGKDCHVPEGSCDLICKFKTGEWTDINLNSLAGRTYETDYEGKTVTFSPCGGMKVGSEECAAITIGDDVFGLHATEWKKAEGASMNFVGLDGKSSTMYMVCKEDALEPEFTHAFGSGDKLWFYFRHVCNCKGKCDDNGVLPSA